MKFKVVVVSWWLAVALVYLATRYPDRVRALTPSPRVHALVSWIDDAFYLPLTDRKEQRR